MNNIIISNTRYQGRFYLGCGLNSYGSRWDLLVALVNTALDLWGP
jgi:hypothetical protein